MNPIILIKSDLSKTGGLEKYTWQLAQDFCALNAPVTLLTSNVTDAPFSHPLLNIVSFSSKQPSSVWKLLYFNQACQNYLKKHPSETIFSLDRTTAQTHIRAGNGVHAQYLKHRMKEEGKLKSLSFYLNPLHRTILSVEKKAFENPDLKILFANSSMVREEILSHYATAPEKICVIHNGVEWLKKQADFDAWREKRLFALNSCGLDPSLFQFLFIGHNYKRKGLDKLLLALAKLPKDTFQLSVVGHDKNLPFFQNLAEKLNLTKNVFFFGSSQDLIPFYQLADALVIPSLYDPFANVTVEALAMGVFVVSSKNNGGSEILDDRLGTVIDDLYDVDSFVKALNVALARPKNPMRALQIRTAVAHLDFSRQLRLMTQAVLNRHPA